MDSSTRETLINDLDDFIATAENEIDSVLSTLGWSAEYLQLKDDDENVNCPLDPAHKLPSQSLSRHVESCSLIKEGYSKEEIARLPPDSNFFYEQSPIVVTVAFDENLQNSILQSTKSMNADDFEKRSFKRKLPRNGERAAAEFSRQERLTMYDYVVAQGKAAMKESGISIESMHLNFDKRDESQKVKSRLELLAEERDYKRRRQSYRAKNVHITKKSYTEVIRDVIQTQMEYLRPEKESNSPSESEGVDVKSNITEDRRTTTSEGGSGRYSRKRSRSRTPSFNEKRGRRKTRDSSSCKMRSRSSEDRRRDHSTRRDSNDSSHHSRSKSHKKKHKHHRSRHGSTNRD